MSLYCITFLYSYTQTYLQKLAVLPLLNVKSLVYLNKSCTNKFCRRGYGLRENDSSIYFSRITIPAFHAGDLKEGKKVQIYYSHIPINITYDIYRELNHKLSDYMRAWKQQSNTITATSGR